MVHNNLPYAWHCGILYKTIFSHSVILVFGLCSCSSEYDKYIHEVKTGYLGGYLDSSISEVFSQVMPNGKWSGGETDDGKIIVEYKSELSGGKIQIQFNVSDDDNFKVSAIKGDSLQPKTASDAGAVMRSLYIQHYSAKYPAKADENILPREPYENLLNGISAVYAEKAKNPIDISIQLDKSKDEVQAVLNINISDDGLADTRLSIIFNSDNSSINSVEISGSRVYLLFGVQTYQTFHGIDSKISDRFEKVSERDNQDVTVSVLFIRNNSEDSFSISYNSETDCITDIIYIKKWI